ncbi:MAG: serine hydrolase [Clostridia bacterium]|nr:serine hydrolase [Clostridia bacterium]
MDERLSLEKRIKAELYSYDGEMSVYINDLRGSKVEIGADEEFETASCIKTFILACLYEQIAAGKCSEEDLLTYKESHFIDGSGVIRSLNFGAQLTAVNTATLMIIVSDNIATNMMIDYLGIDTINESIQRFGCPHTKLHNPINFTLYDKLGTTTPREYASIFERIAEGKLIDPVHDAKMLAIFRKQHYNSMITKFFTPYYMDSEDTGDDELIWVASKSGSMNACRNDGGIVNTPYGSYVIVLMNKNFGDSLYYAEHPATVFGAKVSRMILDQYLALEGRLKL